MDEKSTKPIIAYRDQDFMGSRAARPLRILAEYTRPLSRFEHTHVRDTIVIYGSARAPSPEQMAAREDGESAPGLTHMARYYEDTRELARRLTQWSKDLDRDDRRFVVCTGGGPGIMEAANRGASEARGMNVGLGIELPFEASGNPYITRELAFEFHYFFMRKFWFVYLAKAIVIMPGGFGTMDELFEVLTLAQTGKLKKPIALVLYGGDFWDKVLNLDALVEFGVISAKDLDLFHRSDSVDDTFDYITRQLTANHLGDTGPMI